MHWDHGIEDTDTLDIVRDDYSFGSSICMDSAESTRTEGSVTHSHRKEDLVISIAREEDSVITIRIINTNINSL